MDQFNQTSQFCMFCFIKYGFTCQMWMFGGFPWRSTHLSVLLDWLDFDWLLIRSHVCCLTDPGVSLPSAGGTKSHTDSTSSFLAKLFLICGHLDRFFSYYLCFTSLQSVSFTQISPLAMRSSYLCTSHIFADTTYCTARCYIWKSWRGKFLWPKFDS